MIKWLFTFHHSGKVARQFSVNSPRGPAQPIILCDYFWLMPYALSLSLSLIRFEREHQRAREKKDVAEAELRTAVARESGGPDHAAVSQQTHQPPVVARAIQRLRFCDDMLGVAKENADRMKALDTAIHTLQEGQGNTVTITGEEGGQVQRVEQFNELFGHEIEEALDADPRDYD